MTPYYDRDGITIFHARCEDVLPDIDPATVDLLLTDPPYGIALDVDYDGRGMPSQRKWESVANDAARFDPADLLTFKRAVLWGGNNFASSLPDLGSGWLVWRKTNAHPFASECELAWTNVTRRIVSYVSSARPEGTYLHPTQKPTGLMRWIIDRWTKPGDLVLDPYMGSGPVAQACHELGRRYIGIELVGDYCAIAVTRLRQGTLDFGGAA